MELYKRTDSPYWWITWYDRNGRRCRESTGTTNKKEAEVILGNLRNEQFLEEQFGKKPRVSFKEVFTEYATIQKREKRHNFMESTRYRLRTIFEHFGDCSLDEISPVMIEQFKSARLEAGLALDTVQRDLTVLKAILNMAHRQGFLDQVPVFPRFKKGNERNRWLTLDEEKRLLLAAPAHLVSIIKFTVDTGARRSEVLGLDWRQVNLEPGGERVTFVKTKNGEDRTLRLCERAVDTLNSIGPKEKGPVFTYQGHAIKSLKTSFNNAVKRATLEDVRFHDLRHTFASRLVQNGVTLHQLMKLMGHNSYTMVLRYAHLAPDYQDEAMEVLNFLHGHDLDTVENSRAG